MTVKKRCKCTSFFYTATYRFFHTDGIGWIDGLDQAANSAGGMKTYTSLPHITVCNALVLQKIFSGLKTREAMLDMICIS